VVSFGSVVGLGDVVNLGGVLGDVVNLGDVLGDGLGGVKG
jgi:hypothetical protein